MGNYTSERKLDHLRICAEEDVEHHAHESLFDDIMLVHNALPEIDIDQIDLSIEFLGKTLQAPLMIAPMTGGHPETEKINQALALCAEQLGLAMGVGSQRAALEDPSQGSSFTIVRKSAPNAFICANIGVPQLLAYGAEVAQNVIDMLDADAVMIHLNFLHEAVQPKGDVNATGCVSAIEDVCRSIDKPVIVRETGAGISAKVAAMLVDLGVSAIDISGAGGTTWAGVETRRARSERNYKLARLGDVFWDWGIPTPISIAECASMPVPIIASGGIRTGLDVAKSIALGASICGVALPLLRAAMQGPKKVMEAVSEIIAGLGVAMFLTGAEDVEQLQHADITITGRTREILEQRGFLENVLSR